MEPPEVVVGNQREHVVFHVVVHLPVEEAIDGVHIDRPAVQPMIEHVFGHARMLRVAVDGHEPGAVEAGQADKHQRQDAARANRQADDARVDQHVDAGPKDHFAILRFRNERLLLRGEPAGAVQQDIAVEEEGGVDAARSQQHGEQMRRPGHGYLRVAPDDQGVAVVAGVAPTPAGRFPQHHERGDLVERVVHPIGLEGRAVAGLMPARVRGRGVEGAVDQEGGHGPPRAPEHETTHAGGDDQREPEERVADARAVSALEQFAHRLLRHGRSIPGRLGQTFFNGPRGVLAHQAVVAQSDFLHAKHGGILPG